MTSPGLRSAARLVIRTGLLTSLEQQEKQRPGVLRILAYHRVAPVSPAWGCMDPSLISATPDAFAAQMSFLASDCRLLTPEEAVAGATGDYRFPPRAVLVTFDDAYRDFAEFAWPVLRERGVPVALFAPTAYLAAAGAFWWDRLYAAFRCSSRRSVVWGGVTRTLATPEARLLAFEAAKARAKALDHRAAMIWVDALCAELGEPELPCRPQLSWTEVEELSAQGVRVAPHTRTHPVLSRLAPEEARAEIEGACLDLCRHLGACLPLFAYPCGGRADICAGLVAILRGAGILAAVTTLPGHNRAGSDPFALRRIPVSPSLSLDEFRLTLTGWYAAYAACRSPQRRH